MHDTNEPDEPLGASQVRGNDCSPERVLSVGANVAAASIAAIRTVFARKDDLLAQVSE